MKKILIGIAAGLVLAGAGATSASAVTVPPTSADDVVYTMTDHIRSAWKMDTLSAKTDPDKLLGKPGQYVSAAVVFDEKATCLNWNRPGVKCGAKVEVFRTPQAAIARMHYLKKTAPDLSPFSKKAEDDERRGNAVLRTSNQVGIAKVANYQLAFENALQETARG